MRKMFFMEFGNTLDTFNILKQGVNNWLRWREIVYSMNKPRFSISRLLKNYLHCHCSVKNRLKMLVYQV